MKKDGVMLTNEQVEQQIKQYADVMGISVDEAREKLTKLGADQIKDKLKKALKNEK